MCLVQRVVNLLMSFNCQYHFQWSEGVSTGNCLDQTGPGHVWGTPSPLLVAVGRAIPSHGGQCHRREGGLLLQRSGSWGSQRKPASEQLSSLHAPCLYLCSGTCPYCPQDGLLPGNKRWSKPVLLWVAFGHSIYGRSINKVEHIPKP